MFSPWHGLTQWSLTYTCPEGHSHLTDPQDSNIVSPCPQCNHHQSLFTRASSIPDWCSICLQVWSFCPTFWRFNSNFCQTQVWGVPCLTPPTLSVLCSWHILLSIAHSIVPDTGVDTWPFWKDQSCDWQWIEGWMEGQVHVKWMTVEWRNGCMLENKRSSYEGAAGG